MQLLDLLHIKMLHNTQHWQRCEANDTLRDYLLKLYSALNPRIRKHTVISQYHKIWILNKTNNIFIYQRIQRNFKKYDAMLIMSNTKVTIIISFI